MAKLLKKVIFEYKGEIHTLEGKAARDWLKEVNSYIITQALRTSSSGMSKYNWKITKR